MLPLPCGGSPLLLGAWLLWVQSCLSLRVLSGQKICYGDSTHPCYKIAYFQDLSRRLGFQEAHLACQIDGGVLLSLQSETEQKLIENMLQNLTKSGPRISDGDFWIGLWRSGEGQTTASACPDLYKWTDGSSSLFRNWYTDEPSCGSEACVVMYHQPTANPGLGGPYLYQWNDDRCNMKHNFICKYDPDDILEKELGDRADPDYEVRTTVPEGKPHDSSMPEDHFPVVVTETVKVEQKLVRTSLHYGFLRTHGKTVAWRYRHMTEKKAGITFFPFRIYYNVMSDISLEWLGIAMDQQNELEAPP
ncbi:chondrolectin isoform X1 [Rhineura floridana]|uniref:chondrolectin isoform X1 n=1 Tax=Rhineura floridana TaxID=261503 RepID=UPI002AC81874|nr:chondrolectin isoform X1 [Rhineura floridana]